VPTGSLHVVIVGAGCAGLALARCLHQAGVSCAVHEAQPAMTENGLRQLLLAGLEDQVHFGKEFTHYDQQADGSVTALFADGSSASGQVLVAADGTHSPVRSQYLPRAVTGPLPAWRPTNVTLVGDAIRAVKSGRRSGANAALRDALLLSHALAAVRGGRVGLLNAIGAYEAEAIRSGSSRAAWTRGSRDGATALECLAQLIA
jgi:2-polyprenyl-6-methoxyphenol hydroxylase-like FAD-dependent oxidoreductase